MTTSGRISKKTAMKQPLTLFTLVAILFTGHTAEAKGKKDQKSSGTYGCAKFDANENGILDPEERDALLKAFERGETALKALDVNNDGRLDESELAKIVLPAPSKEKKNKKKKADKAS